MVLKWLIAVALSSAFANGKIHVFELKDKWVKVVDQQDAAKYAKFWSGNNTWTMKATAGSNIKVYCTDFRLVIGDNKEVSCSHAKMVVDDGVARNTFCENQYSFHVVGKTTKLVMDLITSNIGGGYLECFAKAVVPLPRDVETMELTPNVGIRGINFPAIRKLDNDKAWRIRTYPNSKISLQCNVKMEGPLDSGVCAKDILTIDAGSGPQVFCRSEPITVISTGREMTMRVETFEGTDSNVDCLVQSITGSSANEINNIQYVEEDSSEHGISPGSKGTTCECGKANRDSGRIVNGTEVKYVSKYPFMVSMQYPNGGHFCGASIISPIHILTAAHCVSDRWQKTKPDIASLKPRVGIQKIWEAADHGETQKLDVKNVHIPQTWFDVKGSLAGDIAILELQNPIKFSKWVGPVCLTPSMPNIVNKFIRAMGWGRTKTEYPDTLMETDVQVMDPWLCNKNPREICFKTGFSTTCYGDSGGPYVYVDPETNRYTQVGLVSYGFGDCNGRFFVGTNTAYWFNWIQQTIAATSRGYGICQKQ